MDALHANYVTWYTVNSIQNNVEFANFITYCAAHFHLTNASEYMFDKVGLQIEVRISFKQR